jgi:hypothetical protein
MPKAHINLRFRGMPSQIYILTALSMPRGREIGFLPRKSKGPSSRQRRIGRGESTCKLPVVESRDDNTRRYLRANVEPPSGTRIGV